MSDRAKRGAKLWAKRRKRGVATAAIATTIGGGDGGGNATEVSPVTTIACFLLLLSIGASLATSYIMAYNVECIGTGSSGSTIMSSDSATISVSGSKISGNTLRGQASGGPPGVPSITVPLPSQAVTPIVTSSNIVSSYQPPPQPEALVGFPATCTPEQFTKVHTQLSPRDCESQPAFTQSCSFTKATAKSGCRDSTTYMRQPFASLVSNDPMTAVMVGYNEDDAVMDWLRLGSHDSVKYDVTKWRQAALITTCPRPALTLPEAKQSARVYMIESDSVKAGKASRVKQTLGLTDEEFRGETTKITSDPGPAAKTLDQWVKDSLPNTASPIHYLRIGRAEGRDYDILASATTILDQVWYLEFGYHWQGPWKGSSFKTLIQTILQKEHGFVCYFQGGTGDLWRITDCWQDHYERRSWAYVTCANTKIDGSKELRTKMEEGFQATLQKNVAY